MSGVQSIFDTIPQTDRFGMFQGSHPDYKKVLQVLDFDKKDVAAASQVPIGSVRYDQKIPAELEERLLEWAQAISLVGEYFKDLDRTVLWFKLSNPLFGGLSPREMIRVGRFKKLQRFIQTALDENKRPE